MAAQSPQPHTGPSLETYTETRFNLLIESIRDRFASEEKFQAERDLRYKEVNIEREKALKIKEEADKAALSLARDIQIYKDEKANELREQINRERGLYASKDDVIASSEKLEATIAPLLQWVSSQQGAGAKGQDNRAFLMSVIAIMVAILAVASHFYK